MSNEQRSICGKVVKNHGMLYAASGAQLLRDICFNKPSEMKKLFKIER